MNRVLVTGANGFIGCQVCLAFAAAGISVRGSVRQPGYAIDGVEIIETGEIGPNTFWSAALKDVDIVVHLAARVHVMKETAADPLAEFRLVNAAGTEQLARAAADAGVRRFVYLSSIGAIKTFSDSPLNELSESNPDTPYGLSKLEAEKVIKKIANKTGMEIVILRPPLVYGPKAPGNFSRLVKLVQRGWPLPLGNVRNLRSFIYVGNLADAIVTCALHPAAAGETYLVSDGEDVSTSELIQRMAIALGCSVRLLPIPSTLIRLAGRLTGKSAAVNRLLGSLVIDSTKIRQDISWTPPFIMTQGLKSTADWYLKRK